MATNSNKIPKMNPAAKRKWLKALRSRQFKQAKGQLHKVDGHCCLGVLDEVCSLGNKAEAVILDFASCQHVGIDMDYEFENDGDTIQDRLAHMNDSGKKFYQIARWIERNL